jgi:hypothetical protein
MSSNYANTVNQYVNMFCAGVMDTLSFHRAAKYVVNSSGVRQEIGMTVRKANIDDVCVMFV